MTIDLDFPTASVGYSSWVFIIEVFIVADAKIILGIDFLCNYNLLVDMRYNCLVDSLTQLKVQCIAFTMPPPSSLSNPQVTSRPSCLCSLLSHNPVARSSPSNTNTSHHHYSLSHQLTYQMTDSLQNVSRSLTRSLSTC